MSGLRTDRVRAIGIFKNRPGVTNEDAKANGPRLVEKIKSIPSVQENLLKYEVTFKTERLPKTLASELGLQDTDFSTMILVEGASHEKIRAALTSPEYRKVIAGALEHATTLENYHWFSGEFITVIEK
ncbi:hypothetical protein B0H14DRAFT_2715592 [Mycena olivaceomarginata]|nr:hypothetical protein B0H14DRAFT_2960218 [Mycena olivaceomarginata]KAJ7875527.1 hypothetical protein B0H14DRAFT_2715592 [Mycena olivaceomarginata]